ncbi:MAG: PLP-dependent aminotransferase family protein, partial [Pseudomonadota bacterium]|nr:PLP-dependent aminotransferase family protein [Pseudomonadota bacterium]
MQDKLGTPGPALEGAADQPLYQRLYVRLRDSILSGVLRPGQRLASSRAMASQLAMARNTVLLAYGQLEVEGYVKTQQGSGHYVSPLLPHRPPPRHKAAKRAPVRRAPASPAPVRNAFEFVPPSLRRRLAPIPFRVNHPALDMFPLDTWTRLQTRIVREARAGAGIAALLGETDAQGEHELRKAIAEHVSIARGVHCSADTIVVTAGAQHAIDMLLRVLTAPGDAVGLEDPCFLGAMSAARAAGCKIAAISVDESGMDIDRGLAQVDNVRLALVCPSKQFPLGVTMSLPRRLALIDWARRRGAWIVEDDYDSEFRFDGKPIPSLQGLDGGGHVIYVGTFSKVLFPSLRVGFIVAPSQLIEPLSAARAVSGRHGSTLEQRLLARFIDEGHLARHVRRMRALYRERQDILLDQCHRRLGDRLRVEHAESGMQTVA